MSNVRGVQYREIYYNYHQSNKPKYTYIDIVYSIHTVSKYTLLTVVTVVLRRSIKFAQMMKVVPKYVIKPCSIIPCMLLLWHAIGDPMTWAWQRHSRTIISWVAERGRGEGRGGFTELQPYSHTAIRHFFSILFPPSRRPLPFFIFCFGDKGNYPAFGGGGWLTNAKNNVNSQFLQY